MLLLKKYPFFPVLLYFIAFSYYFGEDVQYDVQCKWEKQVFVPFLNARRKVPNISLLRFVKILYQIKEVLLLVCQEHF